MKICCVNLNKLMIQVNGMKFENIRIKNFRNFEDVTIDISNKNIFFGLNDVGKTNFLYALRYIFDKNGNPQLDRVD